MKTFAYSAFTPAGKRTKGRLVAENEAAAVRNLKSRGLLADTVAPARHRFGHRSIRLDANEQAVFSRQMSVMLMADVPAETALQAVIEASGHGALHRFCLAIKTDVEEGTPLSEAIEQANAGFAPAYCAVLAAGENTGDLATAFETLARYQEAETETRTSIASAMIYPGIVALVSVLVCGLLLTQVAPEISRLFEANNQPLPLITQRLLSLSDWLERYGSGVFFGIALSIVGLATAWSRPGPRDALDYRLYSMPLVGTLRRAALGASYLRTLALVLESRQPPLAAVESAAGVISVSVFRRQADAATTALREGQTLAQALSPLPFLPPVALHLLQAGEASGRVAVMAHRAALLCETDLERRRKRCVALLDPVLMVCVGSVVLLITLAVLLPIFDLQASIAL